MWLQHNPLASSSDEKLEAAQRGLAQAPQDLNAIYEALTDQILRRCKHTAPIVVGLRWLTFVGLAALLVIIVGGTVDIFYLAVPDELTSLLHAFEIAVSSSSALTTTTWILGWRLQREMLAAYRELSQLTEPRNRAATTGCGRSSGGADC